MMKNSTIFYITSLGPLVGVPAAMYAPPLRYKREALAVQGGLERTQHTSSLELSRGKAIQHIMDVGYYAPAARTTLNLAVFIVFLSEIELGLANPRVHTLRARAGAFRHPAVVCSTTTRNVLYISGQGRVESCWLLATMLTQIWSNTGKR